jgi:trehalose-6-phosphate synthase
MPADDRRRRMTNMHHLVREQNIYRWAGMLLEELARIPAHTGALRV